MQRQQLYRFLPELLCELVTVVESRTLPSERLSPCKPATCTALTILTGDQAFYLSVEYLAIADFIGIYLSMAPHYISLLCIGFQANLDRIFVPYLLTITSEQDSQNILFKI